MKKLFTLQKVSVVLFIIACCCAFIYSLGFMSDYRNLFGYVLPLNESIAHFHDDLMQDFNQVIFWFSVVGLVGILGIFIFEIQKKVCDKSSISVITFFGAISLISAIYALVMLPILYGEYNLVDFSNAALEMGEDYVHVYKYNAFYFGYAVYGFVAVISILTIVSTWLSRITFLKEKAGR